MKLKSFFVLLCLFSSLSLAQEKYTSGEAAKHIGEEAIVFGLLAQVSTPSNGIIYLNIDEKYPKNEFTGVIFKKYAELFPEIKELVGKRIELSGKIQEYKGKPQIVITKPEQVKIIE